MEEDKPIHIIKLNTENNKYELSANLEQILLNDDVKDCEIAVISIAEQESNSCLLNFFLCYLYAEDEQKRNGKWIENADTQLTGIKWGLNSDRKFDGIWIWSKIFTKILPNDQKIGIMLMYTQSSFKGDDFSIAFTISALLSSTQIFNVSALMFDYYLHHFDALIRYGSIAGKNSHLQKLMFIVRNWFPVELNGGQRYLQFHSKSLEGVNKCFETIDCFAIPYLTNNFNEELEFKSRLLELIPLIFAPQAKRIQGVSIRVADLLEYFQLYFDLLKDRQFPPAEKVFAETCNLVAYKVAMEYYEGEMKRIFACGTVLTEAQFESTHITVKNYAINCMLTFFAELSESYRSDYVNKLHLSLENKLKFDWKQYVEKKQKDAKKTEAVAKNQNSDIIIAIDFGTTYTRVAVFENGNVKIIKKEDGHRATPSYVAFTDEGRLFGDAAENEVVLNPNQTIFQIKRMLGSRFENSNVAHDIQHWPFNVSHENGKLQVKYKKEQKSFSPEQICAMILLKMKEMAENYTGKKVTSAVITVPACFRNSQRQAILDAARIADLTVRILDETIAAAIAYGFDTKFKNKENVLIFDLGGGTLNVSIVSIENGNFEVKSTDGDPHLGGMDFINLLVKHFMEEFEEKNHLEGIKNDKRAVQRLRKECEKAITTLSVARQSCIGIYPLCNGIDFCSSITQTKFEELSKKLIMRIEKVVNLVLQNANMVNSEIDEILLVGGSSRIPKIQQLLQVIFNGKELKKTVNPDEAIVYGAARIAAQLKDNLLQQFVALVQYHNLEVRILPCSDTYLMIKKNSPIPITINKEIRTLNENIGTQVDIIEDGIVIGTTHIDSGIRSISVTFNINLNGILEITVLNKKLLLKRNVTDEEIQQMSINIANYCKEDQDRKDKILAKNNLESACFKLQLLTNTNISKKDRILINERCDGIFSWLKKNELENIKEYERIRKAVERMYSRLAR